MGDEEKQREQESKARQALNKMKAELSALLSVPLYDLGMGMGMGMGMGTGAGSGAAAGSASASSQRASGKGRKGGGHSGLAGAVGAGARRRGFVVFAK